MINNCIAIAESLGSGFYSLAYYSHLIPLVIIFFLAIFVLYKTKFSFLSVIFASFSLFFCLWLAGDLVAWVSGKYNLITFIWGQLDLINILFFSLAAYFVAVVIKGEDVSWKQKLFLFAITLPGFYVTYTLGTVVNFDQTWCNVTNSDFLTTYKLFQEFACIAYILIFGIIELMRNRKIRKRESQVITIAGAFVLFLGVFGVTEYLASTYEAIYTISLYGLFILPIFLVLVVFSIVRLQMFELRRLGTQLLVYVMVIMVATQFLFLENSTNKILNSITLILSVVFGYLLTRNISREQKYLSNIERLAHELESANSRQTSLIHFITHQVKGFFTKSRNIYSMILDGDYGEVSPEIKSIIAEGLASDTRGVYMVQEILSATDFTKGTVKYERKAVDFKSLVQKNINNVKKEAEAKGLAISFESDSDTLKIIGDEEHLNHAVKNLVDNAIHYTPSGSINIRLESKSGKALLSIKDTGIGLSKEDFKNLFTEGGRGADSVKTNVNSTGYGLFIVKQIITAHNGHVWAESEGRNKGATFFVELPVG